MKEVIYYSNQILTEIIFDKLLSTVEKDKVLQSIISQNYIKVVSLKNSTLN